jgi:hypothetical protein
VPLVLHHIGMNKQPTLVVDNVHIITSFKKILGYYQNSYGGI